MSITVSTYMASIKIAPTRKKIYTGSSSEPIEKKRRSGEPNPEICGFMQKIRTLFFFTNRPLFEKLEIIYPPSFMRKIKFR